MRGRFWILLVGLCLLVSSSCIMGSFLPLTITKSDIFDGRSKETLSDLTPNSDQASIVAHLLEAERTKTNTSAIVVNFPDMDRQTAYNIQADILAEKLKTENRIGWKIGYSRMAEDAKTLDPIYGHIMESNKLASGVPLESSMFVADTAVVEGEFVFWIFIKYHKSPFIFSGQ